MRLDGEIVPLDERPLRPEDTARLVRGVLAGELWDVFQHGTEIDFSFNWEGQARFRGNAYHQRGSVALSLRLIPYQIPSFRISACRRCSRAGSTCPKALFW